MNSKDIAGALQALICIFLLCFVIACAPTRTDVYVGESRGQQVGPPPHAPAHGYRAKYTYHYYPDAHVYFDISRRLYFYMEGDKWRVSTLLPNNLHLRLGNYVTIEMDSDKPYTHSKQHKKKYPPGQMKKK